MKYRVKKIIDEIVKDLANIGYMYPVSMGMLFLKIRRGHPTIATIAFSKGGGVGDKIS